MHASRKKTLRVIKQTFMAWGTSLVLMACMSGLGSGAPGSITGSGLFGGTTNQATESGITGVSDTGASESSTASPASEVGTSDFAPITMDAGGVELPVSIAKLESGVPNLSMDAVSMDFAVGESSSWFMRLPLIHEARAEDTPEADSDVDASSVEGEAESADGGDSGADVTESVESTSVTSTAASTDEDLPDGTMGTFSFMCEAGAIFDPNADSASTEPMKFEDFELVLSDGESETDYATPINADGSCDPLKVSNTYIGANFMVSIRPKGDADLGDPQVGLKIATKDKIKAYITTSDTNKQLYKVAFQAQRTYFIAQDDVHDVYGFYSMRYYGGQLEQGYFVEKYKPVRLEVNGSGKQFGFQFSDGGILLYDVNRQKKIVIKSGNGHFSEFDIKNDYFAYVDVIPNVVANHILDKDTTDSKSIKDKIRSDVLPLIEGNNSEVSDEKIADRISSKILTRIKNKTVGSKIKGVEKADILGKINNGTLTATQEEIAEAGFATKAIPLEPRDKYKTIAKTESYELNTNVADNKLNASKFPVLSTALQTNQFDADAGRVVLSENVSLLQQVKMDIDCRTVVKLLRGTDGAQSVIDLGQCYLGVNLEFTRAGHLFMLAERVDKAGLHRSDLYRWTIASNKVELLYTSTGDLSLNDFFVSYDGKWAAFVSQEADALNQIFIYDVAGAKLTQLTNDSAISFYMPKIIDDYRFVVAEGLLKNEDGTFEREIFGIDMATGVPVVMTKTKDPTYDPQPIPKSEFILYKANDEEGNMQIHILGIGKYLPTSASSDEEAVKASTPDLNTLLGGAGLSK